MNKKHLHHIWRQLRVVRPWYFLAIAAILALTSVYSLRQNNLTMVRLRDKVYQADQKNGDVEAALRDLREYVYAHMNTNLTSGNNAIYPPIQLKYSYDRALSSSKSVEGPNTKIYSDAQAECEKQFPKGLSTGGRIPCIQNYVASHGIKEAVLPTASLYEFDFTSPRWSPDVAGLSMVAAAVFLTLFIFRWLSDKWLQAELRD